MKENPEEFFPSPFDSGNDDFEERMDDFDEEYGQETVRSSGAEFFDLISVSIPVLNKPFQTFYFSRSGM